MKKLGALVALAIALFALNAQAYDISNGTYWSPTDGSNTSAPPNGWPSGTYPNQVEGIGQMTMGAIRRWWERAGPAITTTGSSNAYIYTPTNTNYPSALVTGDVYCMISNFANTGSATVNINGIGATTIKEAGSSGLQSLSGGEIQSGQPFCVGYDGTYLDMLTPSAGVLTSAATSLPDLATVGTITSGTWEGTAVGSQYGGTGQNESSATGVGVWSSGTYSVSSTLAASLGGTGANNSSSTGVAQWSSGTYSVSTALASGTTATTQSANDSTTKVATTAFVNPANSLGSSGYQKFASGLIMEWGACANTTCNFTTAFPNNVFSAQATPYSTPGGGYCVISDLTKSQITTSTGNNTCYYMAIGD